MTNDKDKKPSLADRYGKKKKSNTCLILAVVGGVIVAIFAGYAVFYLPKVSEALMEGRAGAAASYVNILSQAVKNYEFDLGGYPASGSANLARALQTKGPKNLPYYEFMPGSLNEKGEISDPLWSDLIIHYRFEDQQFIIYSTGPNREDERGLGDDISTGNK